LAHEVQGGHEDGWRLAAGAQDDLRALLAIALDHGLAIFPRPCRVRKLRRLTCGVEIQAVVAVAKIAREIALFHLTHREHGILAPAVALAAHPHEVRLVRERRVIPVAALEFPVGVDQALETALAQDDLAFGRSIAEEVHRLLRRGAEVLVEADALAAEVAPDEAPVDAHARLDQREILSA